MGAPVSAMCYRLASHRLGCGGGQIGHRSSAQACAFEPDSQGSLDSAQRSSILRHHQAQGLARFAHPGRSSDSMDVGIGTLGEVEIDHV